jgi:hypothetical protein
MPLTISGDTPNFSAATITALTSTTGTVTTLTTTTLSDGTNSTSATNCIQGSAKAWVNFDGTVATPSTIRASYNVSSVTRNGTGDFTVNFTNAFADANYSVSGSASNNASSGSMIMCPLGFSYAPTTTTFRFNTSNSASNINSPYTYVAFFR